MANLQSISWATKVFDRNGFKRIGHNTRLMRTQCGWALEYHRTDVVQFDHFASSSVRELTVNTGGWRTTTTAQRIRHGLHELGLTLSTTDLRGEWRVMDRKGNAWTIRGDRLTLRHDGIEWTRVV
jgi:hypothetical protein